MSPVRRTQVLLLPLLLILAAPTPHTGAQQPSAPAVPDPALPASQVPPPDPSASVTTIHATARLVVLDVVVTDGHGGAVKGLKPADFALAEDGVPQTLASFTEHDAAPPPAPQDQFVTEPRLPPNSFAVRPPVTGNGAMSVIVLGNLSFADAPFVRGQVKDYLKLATFTMPMAIFRLDWQGLHLVQGFTADRQLLLEAANSKRILPPLGFPPPSQTYNRGSLQLTRYLAGIPGRINLIWFGSPVGRERQFPDVTSFVRDMRGSTTVLQLSRIALYTVDAGGLAGVGLGFDSGVSSRAASYGAIIDGNDPFASSNFVSPGLPGLFPGAGFSSGLFTIPDPYGFIAHGELADAAAATGGRAFYNINGFKEIIAEVVQTGSHFYTLSYSPTNPDWNGAYRRIHMEVTGLPAINYSPSLYARLFGWTSDSPKLQYRRGYYAFSVPAPRTTRTAGGNTSSSAADDSGTPVAPTRTLISVSPKGNLSPSRLAQTPMQIAMAFGSLTPVQVHFTVSLTPEPEVIKTKRGTALPPGNFLTAAFEGTPFRNYRIHYQVDPQDLQLLQTALCAYRDDLQFVAVLYRDDGLQANSLASTTHIEVDPANLDRILNSGLVNDQTIAIPTSGNFFLRAAVHEIATGKIGAIEIPAEWIKPVPAEPLQASSKVSTAAR